MPSDKAGTYFHRRYGTFEVKMINPFPVPRPARVFVIPLSCTPNDVVVCTSVAELYSNAEIYGIPKWLKNIAREYAMQNEDTIFHVLIDRRLFEGIR